MTVKTEEWNQTVIWLPAILQGYFIYSRNYVRPANETELYLVPAFLSLLA